MMLVVRTLVLAAWVMMLIGHPITSSASKDTHACANSSISIRSDEPVDHHDICDSAEAALAFFDRLDLELSHPLAIEVGPKLPDWMSETAVGCYEEEEQKILLLTFSAFENREGWFGVPINRPIYRSLVVHEVAHAVASCNFTISEPTIHAQEYVAYVAMFATMSPEFRARVLAVNPGAGFDTETEINELTYSFDPMRFGVEAYRHYVKEGHGDAFLLKIFSGNALTSSVLDLP